eukprot:3708188-Pyramimonas_sp.AAC.1
MRGPPQSKLRLAPLQNRSSRGEDAKESRSRPCVNLLLSHALPEGRTSRRSRRRLNRAYFRPWGL